MNFISTLFGCLTFLCFVSSCGFDNRHIGEEIALGEESSDTANFSADMPCNRVYDTIVTASLIDGECFTENEVNDVKKFNKPILVTKNSLGYARVRSDASSFEVGVTENVMGAVPECTILYGYGPLKHAGGSAGIAYAVLVTDSTGKNYQGYLSSTVVEILSVSPVTH